MAPSPTAASRAVIRPIDPGTDIVCVVCEKPIKFAARSKARQVIANVYEDGAWKRVEHFHEECYEDAGQPFGLAFEPTR